MKISVGKSRKDLNWRVEEISWSDLCKRLSDTLRTGETYNEYKQMKQDERSAIKDVGGFVGGIVVGGRRKRGSIRARSCITLDADYAQDGMWDSITCLNDFAMCIYSTHTHSNKKPRFRIVIPLDREVTPEEYEPLARQIANDFYIEQFDTTTYEPSRLMYWPSTAKDGDFVFEKQDGPLLCATDTLARYKDWRNTAEWPMAAAETNIRSKEADKQGDPESKAGIVGLFCRAYDVETAIAEFIPDTYIQCDERHRYTYVNGSTYGGMVLYENGKFAYSHHSTDPAGGQLCNAFDLIRLHKFGGLDYQMKPDTPITKVPSYVEMQKFAQQDANVKRLSISEKIETSQLDFDEPIEEVKDETQWMTTMRISKSNEIEKRIDNLVKILENDPNIKGKIALDVFSQRVVVRGKVPWRARCMVKDDNWIDADTAGLRMYLENPYDMVAVNGMLKDAWVLTAQKNAFHPVREYLDTLTWDGIPRVETVFVDYMGADDNPYTRTVTKKWLTAAVARVKEPGIKFDNMIVLVGDQGIGKSFFADKLAKTWFTDSIVDLKGNAPIEKIQGKWIAELPELSAMGRKAEIEQIKAYLSTRSDFFRAAYKENPENYPRQCVFFGSTNDPSFLRDVTGNRRFWVVGASTNRRSSLKMFGELTDDKVDQIWAEAVTYYEAGEKLYLDPDMADLAAAEQEKYLEPNDWVGIIEDYLDKPLPANWESWTPNAKREYALGYTDPCDSSALTYVRDVFCLPEIEWEKFGTIAGTKKPFETKQSHSDLMRLSGWEKSKTRVRTKDYGVQFVYYRKKGDADGL